MSSTLSRSLSFASCEGGASSNQVRPYTYIYIYLCYAHRQTRAILYVTNNHLLSFVLNTREAWSRPLLTVDRCDRAALPYKRDICVQWALHSTAESLIPIRSRCLPGVCRSARAKLEDLQARTCDRFDTGDTRDTWDLDTCACRDT